ncbi:ATP-dependent DNA helicase [Hydrogenophaga aquatica]
MTAPDLASLAHEVSSFFAEGGRLSQVHPHYVPRLSQLAMAEAVSDAIEQRQSVAVEAGTGVGKTYAYLVPSLLSGRRVVMSTATKALQDQLYTRDLPAVAQALGLPVRMALLKGRSSYLCRQRLEAAGQRASPDDRYLPEQIRRVEVWSTCTTTGDLAELSGLDERSAIWPLITSTRENCLGGQCPHAKSCHVNIARNQALAADVTVVNHHLFMADWAVREAGVAELLPAAEVLVFDEAHRLPDVCVQFLGTSVSASQWRDWARDVLLGGVRHARGLANWEALALAMESEVKGLAACLPVWGAGPSQERRLNWAGVAPEGVDPDSWRSSIASLRSAAVAACEGLDHVAAAAPELARLHERGLTLLSSFDKVVQGAEPSGAARWVVPGQHFRLTLAPLAVAEAFGSLVLPAGSAERKTWVFTSATLGTDAGLSWFTEALGLGGISTLQLESPFDYAHQAAVHVPESLPEPADPRHAAALAARIWPWIVKLGGRTLVLTTTLRALDAIGKHLAALSQRDLGPAVLVQGEAPKRELLDRFRRASRGGGPGAVLVASASFWEGVDVPGDDLQMVVIDKLPFPPPDDPWVAAKTAALQVAGQRPFKTYFLPETGVALKQGAGRLIRSELDKGLLVIGDTRLLDRPYGKVLRSALPPMRWLHSDEEVQRWLDELVTTVSTRDLPWT